MPYSDYIIYVDESGDHGLQHVNPLYPVFVLSFCIFHKESYANLVVPSLMRLKFKHFGHDMVVLHELDIRKQTGDFGILRNKDRRQAFLSDLNEFVSDSDFTLIAVVINKSNLITRYKYPDNPYEIAMQYGLERIRSFMADKNQLGEITHLVFEQRGRNEDRDLELEFRRVCAGSNFHGEAFPFSVRFASKKANSCGLQLADLTARPIGLRFLRPTQSNRAFDILAKKMYQKKGRIEGLGLKVFP